MERGLTLLEQHPGTSPEWLHAEARLLITRAFSEFEVHGLERGESARDCGRGRAAAASDRRDLAALVHELNGSHRVAQRPASTWRWPSSTRRSRCSPTSTPTTVPPCCSTAGAVHLLRRDLRAARADLSASARLAAELGIDAAGVQGPAQPRVCRSSSPATSRRRCAPFALADALDTDVSRSVWFLDRARVLMEAGLLEEADQAPRPAPPSCCGVSGANQDRAETELARARGRPPAGRLDRWPRPIDARPTRTSAAARASAGRRGPTSPGGRHTSTPRADRPGWPGRSAAPSPRRDEATMDRQLAAHRRRGEPRAGPHRRSRQPAGAGRARSRPSSRPAQRASPPPPGPGRGRARRPATSTRRGASSRPASPRWPTSRPATTASTCARRMAVHGGRLAELDLRIALESGSARVGVHLAGAVAGDVAPPHGGPAAARRGAGRPPGRPARSPPRRSGTARRGGRSSTCGVVSARSSERSGSASGRCTGAVAPSATPRSPTSSRCSTSRTPRSSPSSCWTTGSAPSRSAGGRPRVVTLGAVGRGLRPSMYPRPRATSTRWPGGCCRRRCARRSPASLAHDLDKLDRLLLPSPLTDAGALLVIPSRTLATAPWSLLPRPGGRPTTVALSATGWLRGQTAPIPSPRVSALAGPGLALSGPRSRTSLRPGPAASRPTASTAAPTPSRRPWSPATSSTSRRTGSTTRTTRCSPASGWPTVRCTPTSSLGRAGGRAHRPVGVRPRPRDAAGRRRGPRPDRRAAVASAPRAWSAPCPGSTTRRPYETMLRVPPAAGRRARLPDRAGRGARR